MVGFARLFSREASRSSFVDNSLMAVTGAFVVA